MPRRRQFLLEEVDELHASNFITDHQDLLRTRGQGRSTIGIAAGSSIPPVALLQPPPRSLARKSGGQSRIPSPISASTYWESVPLEDRHWNAIMAHHVVSKVLTIIVKNQVIRGTTVANDKACHWDPGLGRTAWPQLAVKRPAPCQRRAVSRELIVETPTLRTWLARLVRSATACSGLFWRLAGKRARPAAVRCA